MQLVHCTVKLAGDPRKTVRRINVSVPEILVLKAIHGSDAVIELEYAGVRKSKRVDDMDELLKFYGAKAEIETLVKGLFPGARPNLPRTLAEVGYNAPVKVGDTVTEASIDDPSDDVVEDEEVTETEDVVDVSTLKAPARKRAALLA